MGDRHEFHIASRVVGRGHIDHPAIREICRPEGIAMPGFRRWRRNDHRLRKYDPLQR